MPSRAMRPCKTMGCSGLTDDRFCARCRENGAGADTRPTAAQRGYGYKWQRYSAQYLIANPHCFDPFNRHQGQPVPSRVTDHIKPHKGNMQLFWDKANHQALCETCHNYKTATIDGGFGR